MAERDEIITIAVNEGDKQGDAGGRENGAKGGVREGAARRTSRIRRDRKDERKAEAYGAARRRDSAHSPLRNYRLRPSVPDDGVSNLSPLRSPSAAIVPPLPAHLCVSVCFSEPVCVFPSVSVLSICLIYDSPWPLPPASRQRSEQRGQKQRKTYISEERGGQKKEGEESEAAEKHVSNQDKVIAEMHEALAEVPAAPPRHPKPRREVPPRGRQQESSSCWRTFRRGLG